MEVMLLPVHVGAWSRWVVVAMTSLRGRVSMAYLLLISEMSIVISCFVIIGHM